ncbi:MAG: hypothetical protein AMXMBFR53_36790 [Gemmatimonadota bacterium]
MPTTYELDSWVLAYPGRLGHGLQKDTVFAGWYSPESCRGWVPEPGVARVADGLPDRVDRTGALGNAVVPQVAEWLGRRIMEAEAERREAA